MNRPVTACIDDLKAKINTITLLENKVITFTDPESVVRMMKGFQLPAVGVGYMGMRSADIGPGTETKVSRRQGLSAEIVFGVYAAFRDLRTYTAKEAYTDITTQVMDDIRDAIKETDSPTGHRWRFVAEFPAPVGQDVNAHIVWVQTWACPVPRL